MALLTECDCFGFGVGYKHCTPIGVPDLRRGFGSINIALLTECPDIAPQLLPPNLPASNLAASFG